MTAPIRAYVGPNGEGKSLAAMVLSVVPTLMQGRRVLSTCMIDPIEARRWWPKRAGEPQVELLESWRQLSSFTDGLVLLDDVSAQLPSRQAMSLPPQLARVLNMLRHFDVELAWTAPNWSRADVIIREVTQEVTVCRGYMPDWWERESNVPPFWRANARRVQRSRSGWPYNRLFRFKTYDATMFDEFTYHQVKDVKPRSSLWYYRPWHRHQYLYNSQAIVALMDHLDESGRCLECGGYRQRQKCTCPSAIVDTRRPYDPIEGKAKGRPIRAELVP